MKIESRGKYPGVKVHLDEDETRYYLELAQKQVKALDVPAPFQVTTSLSIKLGQKIRSLMAENPNVVKERTSEEIEKALIKERDGAIEKLNKLRQGENWSGK